MSHVATEKSEPNMNRKGGADYSEHFGELNGPQAL